MDRTENSSEVFARYRRVLTTAFPLAVALISQNLLTMVDLAMVARIGTSSVAAIGLANAAYHMLAAFLVGTNISVQAITARREGEGDRLGTGESLNAGMILGFIFGAVIACLLVPQTPLIFSWLTTDPEVAEAGALYLAARLAAQPVTGINFALYGFWHGVTRPLVYLPSLLVMQVFNVFFNYVLIFGNFGFPRLGAFGAGLGSLLATIIGCVMQIAVTCVLARDRGVFRILPRIALLIKTVRLIVANGLQQVFLFSAFMALFWIISQIGVSELAIATVLCYLVVLTTMPCQAAGHAAGALVSQSLGRGDPAAARRWGWTGFIIAGVFSAAIAFPLLVAPDSVMKLILHDPALVPMAHDPALLTVAVLVVEATGVAICYSLLGAGYVMPVVITVAVAMWCICLPLVYLLGPCLGYGLMVVWTVLAMIRIGQALVFVTMWVRGRWQFVKL